MTKTKIGVLGAGTWGTALARMLARNGCDVTMWSALPDELKAMSVTHAHPNREDTDLEESFTDELIDEMLYGGLQNG